MQGPLLTLVPRLCHSVCGGNGCGFVMAVWRICGGGYVVVGCSVCMYVIWACGVYIMYLVRDMCGAVYVGLWWPCGVCGGGVLCVYVCVGVWGVWWGALCVCGERVAYLWWGV